MPADIDIDFQSDFDPSTIFKQSVQASMVNKKNELVKHPCGRYFQKMAIDSVTGFAAIPYEEAEVLGYFKIDFLHLSHIDPFLSKQEIRELSKKDPNWNLLNDENNVKKLLHINRQYELLQKVNPHSVDDLADVLALMRPGKRQLLPRYLTNKKEARKWLYAKTENYSFKRSHAIAYALTIVLQLHLIEQNRL